jgi:hypothetical protein
MKTANATTLQGQIRALVKNKDENANEFTKDADYFFNTKLRKYTTWEDDHDAKVLFEENVLQCADVCMQRLLQFIRTCPVHSIPNHWVWKFVADNLGPTYTMVVYKDHFAYKRDGVSESDLEHHSFLSEDFEEYHPTYRRWKQSSEPKPNPPMKGSYVVAHIDK